MTKTLIALLTAASFMTIGAAQAADKPMDKPVAEAAKPADSAKPAKQVKKHGKKHTDKKVAAENSAGTAPAK